MVELCPDAINAIANNLGAQTEPNKGESNSWACLICPTSVLPVLKNTVAANIKMKAFTKKAIFKAIALSKKFSLKALLIPELSRLIFRVCTKAECKYKLCGITVAPIIPMAI